MSDDDEKFETWVTDAAQDYHRPPRDIPRDAMWAAIAPQVARPVAPSPEVTPLRRRVATRWVPLAAAATLLVAVSYQVGKHAGTPAPATASIAPARAAAPSAAVTYDVAAAQHFGRAEALLTSLRSGSSTLEAPVQRWAHDLLADTRLLLDSPAASDPVRRRLLQDLELTLAQIVQLPAASTPDDQHIVDRSLQRGELLTRIRSIVPSPVSGT